MKWNHDTDQNDVGRVHADPIQHVSLYQVVFAGEEVTELTTNIIAESMYAQSDTGGNEYLL